MTERRPLAVSVGDPAGVGPEVAARAALELAETERVLLFGDARRLERLVQEGGGRAARVLPEQAARLARGDVGLVDVGPVPDEAVHVRAPSASGGAAQLAALDAAIACVRSGYARALVTGPTSKAAIALAGVSFIGQTEHLARAAGLADDDVTMMFLGPRLRVALVTTHVSVRKVADEIRPERVERAIVHLSQALARLGAGRDGADCVIVVTGLNPHASEAGLFGNEEAERIEPGVRRGEARATGGGLRFVVRGPIAAEAALRDAAAGRADGVVAMIHDQATIASKLVDWGNAANVTWGLPFVRTSVDHGVAYDAAARGDASSDGMLAAVRMATELTRGEP